MPSIIDSKCVFITGATSGIGRALAFAIAKLPSHPHIIAAGRRQDRLDELAQQGFEVVKMEFDTDAATIKKSIDDVLSKFPKIDTIILGAGIQREAHFNREAPVNIDSLYSEINVNYLSVLATITHFLPHLKKIASPDSPAFIIPITSGFGIMFGEWVPNYSASKAALHALTIGLQAQFQDTDIHVQEIIPPLVESELHDAEGTSEKLTSIWMPLDEYIKETMKQLLAGKAQITSGMATDALNKFDKRKIEISMTRAKTGSRNSNIM